MDDLQQTQQERDGSADSMHNMIDEVNVAKIWGGPIDQQVRITVIDERAN